VFNTEQFSTRPGHAQLARVRPDGTGLEQLSFDERVNWFPHVAPTGDVAVYLSYPPGTLGHPADLPVKLRLVAVDAWQEPTTLVALNGGQGTINVPSWAPDGSAFAFVDYPFDQQTDRQKSINAFT
jgi:Tol biopolymer transport system component